MVLIDYKLNIFCHKGSNHTACLRNISNFLLNFNGYQNSSQYQGIQEETLEN